MKSIILTGGQGERLRPLTLTRNKCTLEVNHKPLIDYSLENCLYLYHKGLIEKEVIIVIGYRGPDIMRLHPENYRDLRIRYKTQNGFTTVDALLTAKENIKEPFLLMLGDEILINPMHKEMVKYYLTFPELDGVMGVVKGKIREVERTYTLRFNKTFVRRVVEKPEVPFNNYIGTGNCILPPEYFNWISNVKFRSKGDFVTPIQTGINKGYKFGHYQIADKYFNINTLEDLKEAEECFQPMRQLL